MEYHPNISGGSAKGDWISRLSSYPEIQNDWIANFVRSIANKQIEALLSLLAAREDAESIDEYYERMFLASIDDLERSQ